MCIRDRFYKKDKLIFKKREVRVYDKGPTFFLACHFAEGIKKAGKKELVEDSTKQFWFVESHFQSGWSEADAVRVKGAE